MNARLGADPVDAEEPGLAIPQQRCGVDRQHGIEACCENRGRDRIDGIDDGVHEGIGRVRANKECANGGAGEGQAERPCPGESCEESRCGHGRNDEGRDEDDGRDPRAKPVRELQCERAGEGLCDEDEGSSWKGGFDLRSEPGMVERRVGREGDRVDSPGPSAARAAAAEPKSAPVPPCLAGG